MDFNLVVVSGMVAAPPEVRVAGNPPSGRLLLTVRSTRPVRRVDLLPVAAQLDQIPLGTAAGDAVWVTGSLQRCFSQASGRSRLEIVAHHIEPRRPAALKD